MEEEQTSSGEDENDGEENKDENGEKKKKEKKKVPRYSSWKNVRITTTVFRDIVKRLQSFGIINLIVEPAKITDNTHLVLFPYDDELRNAFHEHEVWKSQRENIDVYINS